MNKYNIQSLRDLSIESVAERLGLKVNKHKSLCPFHNDTHPSLSFRLATNSFKCFVCGAHGSVIDLAMHVLKVDFNKACEWLAEENNVVLTERQPAQKPRPEKQYPPDTRFLGSLVARPVLNEEAQKFLFEKRQYNPKVIKWLGISSINKPAPCWRYGTPFYDAPSLLFPYRDINGLVQNVQSRYIGQEFGKPRFKFPSNSSIHVFNLPIVKYLKDGEPVYISEGITDCIALMSSGYKAIAIPSATLLKPEDLAPLSGRQLHIWPDRDEAGERMYNQLLSAANGIGCSVIGHNLPEGCKDYSEFYLKKLRHGN